MSKSILSDCCLRETEAGTQVEYPLGGKTWGINYKISVCTCCGKPCETLELYVCEECGIISDCESTVCTKCEGVAV